MMVTEDKCAPYRWAGLAGAIILLMMPAGWRGEAQGVEIRVSNDFSLTHNEVSGAGRDQSFLTEGTRYLDVFNLFGHGEGAGYQYHFNLGAKATNDPRNDIQKYSLTNIQGRISNQIHTITAGDTFEAFSQYTLNTAVKGASYRYTDAGTRRPEVAVVTGVAYARWDNFWGTDAIERQVLAARVRQAVTGDLWLALNYVQSEDQGRVAGLPLYDTRTLGFDWEYRPIPGLTVRGESAWIDTDESPAVAPKADFNGDAHKIEAIGDGGPSRVHLEYERISPEFLTLLGSATPDREKARARWRYRPSRTVTWNYGFLWYRDNLDGQLVARTDHYRPEVGLSLRQLFQRRYSVLNFTYKFDRAHGSRSTSDHFIVAGYRDRFGIFDSETNVGATFYDTTDRRDEEELFFNTVLSMRKTLGEWIFTPSLRLGVWTLEDELVDSRDHIWDYSLGLGLDAPQYKVVSHLRVGHNKLQREAGMDTEKMFANLAVYYRPEFLSRFNSGMLYLRGFVNDFSFSSAGRDFRENSITAGINIQL